MVTNIWKHESQLAVGMAFNTRDSLMHLGESVDFRHHLMHVGVSANASDDLIEKEPRA